MSSTSWSQRFGLSDFEVRDLKNAAGDPLRGALLSGRVSESEYLAWAMETYEIPRVKSDFFRIPVDPVFYEAVKNEYKWNASFVPLAEWNGVLLIGCLEPPNFHFRTKFNARFVLASATELKARFETLEPGSKPIYVPPAQASKPTPVEPAKPTVAPPPPKPIVLAPATAATPPIPASVPPPISATVPLPPQVTANVAVAYDAKTTPIPTPPKAVPVPESVAAPVASNEHEVSLEELMATPDIPLPEAPDVSLAEPDGLVEIPSQASDERMLVPDGFSESAIDLTKDQNTAKTEPTPAPDGLSEKTFMTSVRIDFGALTVSQSDLKKNDPPRLADTEEVTSTNVNKAVAQAATPAVTQPTITQSLNKTTSPSIAPYPPTVPKPPSQPADLKIVTGSGNAVVSNNVDVIPLADCKTYDQLAGATIGRVLKSFDLAMILTFQNGQLVPWKWTEFFNSVKGDKPDPIDLTTASIFRIVFRTCLPYHGYVVASPVNTAYFNAFFRGEIPKHVTIMPVLINRKVAGMVMGIANREVDLRRTLGEMEIIAAEFGTHLDRIKGQKKAA